MKLEYGQGARLGMVIVQTLERYRSVGKAVMGNETEFIQEVKWLYELVGKCEEAIFEPETQTKLGTTEVDDTEEKIKYNIKEMKF